MENNDWEKKEFDLMVRDFTEQGFMAKSEARRRFMEINEQTRLSAFQEGLEEALKIVNTHKAANTEISVYGMHTSLAMNVICEELVEAITSRIEESKKGNV